MAQRPRKRRWPWILGALGALALAGAWWVDRELEPVRLATTVLSGLGEATGLQLRFEGTPEYALRPEPRLLLQGFDARVPGAAAPMFRAERLEISLPWDTVWGGPVVITRVALDRPQLDLAALANWRSARPESPFELPTFTGGLRVTDGTLLGDGWVLDMIALELPSLRPGKPAAATVSGLFERGATFVLLDGRVALEAAGPDTFFNTTLQGRLRDGELDVPLALSWSGRLDATGEGILLTMEPLALDSQSPLPDFEVEGSSRFADALDLGLHGRLQGWPEDWPALPPPLAGREEDIDFAASYAGPPSLSGTASLTLSRGDTRARLELVPAALQAWLDAEAASPLPPLRGVVETPRIDIDGASLEGVRIEFGGAPDAVGSEGGAAAESDD